MPIKISVIIPTLNAAQTIGSLLAALQHQVYAADQFEVLIVDNGSTDGTQEIVANYRFKQLYAATAGPSAARNVGLQAAQGEIVVYLDADMLPTRHWLKHIVASFADPAVILVGGRTLSFKPTTAAQRFIARQMEAFAWTYYFSRRVFPFIASRNLAVCRQVALEIGGWNEEMPTAEDMDFCHRLQQRFNCSIELAPEALAFHQERSTAQALRDQAWHYGQGLADMYLRYPEVGRWHPGKTLLVAWVMSMRYLSPFLWRLTGRPAEDIEFACYHRFWTHWFWKGFFCMRKQRRREAPPAWSNSMAPSFSTE